MRGGNSTPLDKETAFWTVCFFIFFAVSIYLMVSTGLERSKMRQECDSRCGAHKADTSNMSSKEICFCFNGSDWIDNGVLK